MILLRNMCVHTGEGMNEITNNQFIKSPRIMQTLFKNFFNSMILLIISLFVLVIKIFQMSSVKGTLRYRKINFFTTSALFKLQF